MASSMLRWHYRSRHESLIAFSNDKFYGNRLVTFPSSLREDEGLGLKLVYVENGVYDRGKSHKNLLEARRVADLVHEHLCERPDRSVGVVTFSQAQMEAVEDELELRARDDRHFEDLMRSNEHEPFFVKNLENVQGDERDVIIFSIGYGRDAQGRMYMNFGPLNRAGGERRLNVAITRAREKVVLVSSIRASDLDISGTGADGVRVLHAYLDYAERGADALEMEDSGQGGEYESPLEEDVANAIKEMGYQVVPQVGCSGFRVDLGVIDPLQPGRYLLGVECDGASYHSGYVARDKDRIRQEILENLGWRIHRIWSPDWVTRRREEVERLRQALAAVYPKALFASAEEAPNDNRPVGPAVTIEDGAPAWTLASQDRMGADSTWAIPYAVCELSAGAGRLPEFLDEAARARQRKLLLELVQVEGPIHRELVKKRIAAAWGKQVGSRIAAVVDDLVDQARAEGGVEIKGDFVVLAPAPLISYARVPVDGDPRTKRGLEHIPNAEIAIVMLHLTEDGCGISEEGLVAETARVFGFKRTGEKIHDRLLYVVNGLVRIERLRRSGDNLYLP